MENNGLQIHGCRNAGLTLLGLAVLAIGGGGAYAFMKGISKDAQGILVGGILTALLILGLLGLLAVIVGGTALMMMRRERASEGRHQVYYQFPAPGQGQGQLPMQPPWQQYLGWMQSPGMAAPRQITSTVLGEEDGDWD